MTWSFRASFTLVLFDLYSCTHYFWGKKLGGKKITTFYQGRRKGLEIYHGDGKAKSGPKGGQGDFNDPPKVYRKTQKMKQKKNFRGLQRLSSNWPKISESVPAFYRNIKRHKMMPKKNRKNRDLISEI